MSSYFTTIAHNLQHFFMVSTWTIWCRLFHPMQLLWVSCQSQFTFSSGSNVYKAPKITLLQWFSKQTISTIFFGFQSWCLLLLVVASILLCGQIYCISEIDLPSCLSDGSQELFLCSQELFSSSLCLLCNSSMVDVIFIVITIVIILI